MSGLATRLRHRVDIQTLELEQDSESGEVIASWGTLYASVPAEVLTGAGREFIAAGATQGETTARIVMRWFPVSESDMYAWRILWDGRVYNIGSIETDATGRREWRIKCAAGVNDGT